MSTDISYTFHRRHLLYKQVKVHKYFYFTSICIFMYFFIFFLLIEYIFNPFYFFKVSLGHIGNLVPDAGCRKKITIVDMRMLLNVTN